MKYTKKPVTVDAIQYEGTYQSVQQIREWMANEEVLVTYSCEDSSPDCPDTDHTLLMTTVEKSVWSGPGDWIIRDASGALSSCRSDIFTDTYELDAS